MKFIVVAVVVCMFGITIHARTISKRSSDSSICSGSTPCGWEIYRPESRVSDFFVNSPCQCADGMRCVRYRDDISIAAYIYRCRPNDEEGAQVKENIGSIPISIKDEGLYELKIDDVAMIFYITVTNTGKDFVRLHINSSRCCQKVDKDDMDCESMRIHGGDMGNLYPRDFRNLTLIYVNLVLHERKGDCDMAISDDKGNVIKRNVKFDTTLVKDGETLIPRLMQQYYSHQDVTKCSSIDEDPLNECRPYECEVRYDGHRNYFNRTSKRCLPVPKCAAHKGKSSALMVYNVETNTCHQLSDEMKDFKQFLGGKPGVHGLTQAHSYPIRVQCHNGQRDNSSKNGQWCICDPGWTSAPLDHSAFHPDLQVYHMCTVWLGGKGGVYKGPPIKKKDHTPTIIFAFSMLGATFITLCFILCWVIYKKKKKQQDADSLSYYELPSEEEYEMKEHSLDSEAE
ncbi:hypothetical protein JTE90_011471 [Oedothorax gibbosus]|uniref:Uncharacterized protein n=1 Tax=Oedothorax gibbosus TaxID=931172 RepID=A0AAV6VE16_9ARAC|nr:hypothetical protein JTE90_011471 [Oedothorax gibbosus]